MDRELRELQEERSSLVALQKMAGFQWLLQVAESQAESRKKSVFLKPLSSMDECLEQEYRKGEIAGIELFRQLVDIQLSELNEEIQRRTGDEEQSA